MPTTKLYNTLKKQIMQLRPGERVHFSLGVECKPVSKRNQNAY